MPQGLFLYAMGPLSSHRNAGGSQSEVFRVLRNFFLGNAPPATSGTSFPIPDPPTSSGVPSYPHSYLVLWHKNHYLIFQMVVGEIDLWTRLNPVDCHSQSVQLSRSRILMNTTGK